MAKEKNSAVANESAEKTEHRVRMKVSKDCKNSVRYGSDKADLPFDNIYVMKSTWEEMPGEIEVIVRRIG